MDVSLSLEAYLCLLDILTTRTCSHCHEPKNLQAFYWREDRQVYNAKCKACEKIYNTQDHFKNKARNNIRSRIGERARNLKIRREVIEYYGGQCKCCGESHFSFLAIDHINGQGNQHRKVVHIGSTFMRYIKKQGFPPVYRVLCHNCNTAYGNYGWCPHQETVQIWVANNYYRRMKYRLIQAYGGTCQCCSETSMCFLQIDHVNGKGTQQRMALGGNTNLYWWIIKRNYPKTFRILCANCNLSRGFYGFCPHTGDHPQISLF